jgi:hypothetical protein
MRYKTACTAAKMALMRQEWALPCELNWNGLKFKHACQIGRQRSIMYVDTGRTAIRSKWIPESLHMTAKQLNNQILLVKQAWNARVPTFPQNNIKKVKACVQREGKGIPFLTTTELSKPSPPLCYCQMMLFFLVRAVKDVLWYDETGP